MRETGARYARGQAMVEFAIIMAALLLLLSGSVELGSAFLGSQRTGEAAEAGVNEWVRAVGGAGVYDNIYGADFEITGSPFGAGAGLGDHLAGAFTRPTCGTSPGEYDDGSPADSVTRGGTAVYLFNPNPIDITNCTGSDDIGSGVRTRQALLVEQLPALNRALYPLYQLRCGDSSGAEVACADPAATQSYYRLPGRLDPLADTVTLAMLDGDPDSGTFQMPLADSPRPTFEIDCAIAASTAFGACDSEDAPADVCWDSVDGHPMACEVRIRVRFRQVFYSFLQFPFVYWMDPLPQEALDQLDTGPGGSGEALGGEVGRGGVRLFNRTFQGCYETVTSPPTAGMLGSRIVRACN